MKRRDFLRISAQTGLIVSVSPSLGAQVSSESKRVIIIGAGMAGISAAFFLKGEGHDPIILESNNRVGGRIWTDRSSGTPLDMGAGWIEGDVGNPIYKIAYKNGIENVVSEYGNSYVYNVDGVVDDDLSARLYNKVNKVYKQTKSYWKDEDFKKDRSVGDILNEVASYYDLSREEHIALQWLVATNEIDYACEFDNYSFYWQRTGDGYYGDDRVMPNGYDQIPKTLAEGQDIRLNTEVTEIRDNGSKVTIETKSGQSYTGDYVIVTVPLGILKARKIKFTEDMPDWKWQAIDDMGMGELYKLAIGYDEAFWPDDRDNLSYLSLNKGEFPIFLNWMYYTKKPFLIGAVGGEFMNSLKGLTNDMIGTKLSRLFSKMFQSNIDEPDFLRIARWGENPHSLGAYSYTPVGVRGNETTEKLAQAVGRIHFAGEATSAEYPATVHGAYTSGEREAYKIIKRKD